MLDKSMSKSRIESALKEQGDFVQIDWLKKFLEGNSVPRDIKKFACQKLADLYEKKFMLSEAAKMYENLGMLSIAYSDKIKYFIKETGLWIKKGEFDHADRAMRRAIREANAVQKKEIYTEIKNLYRKQTENYEKDLKRNHAAKIYEKLLQMGLEDDEKKEVREKLIRLYKKLGKFKDAKHLEELMD